MAQYHNFTVNSKCFQRHWLPRQIQLSMVHVRNCSHRQTEADRQSRTLAHLVLFGARRKASALGIQLGEAAGDALHTGVQHAVLVILRVEVVLVALSLVHGHHRRILTEKGEEKKKKYLFIA